MRTDTRRRLNSHARTAAEQFESHIVHNRVYEQIQGQHGDHDLRRVIDAAEEAYDISERRERSTGRDDVVRATFDAAETLEQQLETLIDEQVAEACAVIVRDAETWTDAWDGDELSDAVDEAQQWLDDHPEYEAVAEEVPAGD